MYQFIDVNEVSESAMLPSEALSINGEYLENLIPGYRTLAVTGREALSAELDYYEMTARDGAKNKSKRYPPRTIVVKYQLLAKDASEFREAFNRLGGILSVNDATLIFRDEPDKFFVGTVTEIGDVEGGRNSVTGEFEIFCADPFKYSVIEYEAAVDEVNHTIFVDYGGTYKSFPKLCADFYKTSDNESEISSNGECGFIAFFNEKEKIIQLGNPDELDATTTPQSSTTLVNSVFNQAGSFGETAKSQWKQNSGITTGSDVVQNGTAGMGVATYAAPSVPKDTSGTLLDNKATMQGAPIFYYTVKAKTSGRTVNSVKVTATITAKLKYSTSYFGRPYALKGQIYVGGSWHPVVIKQPDEMWRGQSGHTVNVTFTVNGLTEATTSLTGIKFKVDRTDSSGAVTGKLPETGCANLPVSKYESSTPSGYYLTSTSYGTGDNWHGASVTRAFENAVNCKMIFSNGFSVGSESDSANQVGIFQALLVSGSSTNRQILAGISLSKNAYGNQAKLFYFVKGVKVYETEVDVSKGNNLFKDGVSSIIEKQGESINFNVGGVSKKFTDATLKDVAATEVTFLFATHGTKKPLSCNGLYSAKVIREVSEGVENIRNVFTPNDSVIADCETGNVYRNGALEQDLGALGNDWEEFYLESGMNQIGTAYSEFVPSSYAPTFKVKYREVFL